jgi:hypothetical protein
MAAVAGMFDGAGLALGLWLYRSRIAPLLHQDLTAAKYDPVAAKVRSLQNLKAGKA